MIEKVTHFTLFVNDQDTALDFFVRKIEFELHTDAMFGEMRWLTVCPAGQKYFEVVLMLPTSDEEKNIVGKQSGKIPLLGVATNDCFKDYELFKGRGVQFIEEPSDQPWGIQALFLDSEGNIYNLYQPK